MCQAEATQETCRILIFILYYFLLPSLLLYEKKDSSCRCDYWVGGTCRASALRWRGEARRPMSILSYNGCVTGSTSVLHAAVAGYTCLPACPRVSPALLAAACAAWGADPSGRAAVSHVADVRNAPFAWPPAHIPAGCCAAVRCPARDLRFVTVAGTPPCRRSAGSSARTSRRAAPNGAMRPHGHWRPAAHRARRPGPACLAQAGVRARAGCRRAATHSPRSLAMSTRVDICTGC